MGSESFAPGGCLGGQRHLSGEPDIPCLSAHYPPRSQRRSEVRRIASPAGILLYLFIGKSRQNLNLFFYHRQKLYLAKRFLFIAENLFV
jgi:hypothetical protein